MRSYQVHRRLRLTLKRYFRDDFLFTIKNVRSCIVAAEAGVEIGWADEDPDGAVI